MITDEKLLIENIYNIVKKYFNEHNIYKISTKRSSLIKFVASTILYNKYSIITDDWLYIYISQNRTVKNYYYLIKSSRLKGSSISNDIETIIKEIDKIEDNNMQQAEQNVLFGYIIYNVVSYFESKMPITLTNQALTNKENLIYSFTIYFSRLTYCGTVDRLQQLKKYVKKEPTDHLIRKAHSKFLIDLRKYNNNYYLFHNYLLNIFRLSKFKDYFYNIDFIFNE